MITPNGLKVLCQASRLRPDQGEPSQWALLMAEYGQDERKVSSDRRKFQAKAKVAHLAGAWRRSRAVVRWVAAIAALFAR